MVETEQGELGEIGREAFGVLLKLTDTQIQTLYSILNRETREQMALRAGITAEAGRSRRKALYRKLGVEGDRGVLCWAVDHDLVTPMQIVVQIIGSGER